MLVSFTKSRTTYAVLAAQFPFNVPSSCVTERLPELSKANILSALSVAESVNSAPEIVFPTDALIVRSNISCCCWAMNVNLSRAFSWSVDANGSFST